MARFLLNPVFDIETGKLISHDGESHEDAAILFDRALQSQANKSKQTADTTATGYGSEATGEGAQLRKQLEQRAAHPEGYDPTDLNNMLVAQQQATGGANAAITGEGRLAAMRQRNAGGFAPALAEAARSKERILASGGLDVANANAQLKQAQQQQALQQLQGLYGTDTSNQLKAMGLSAEDLQNELAAGRQGWLQNTEGALSSLGELGKGVGAAKQAWGCWIAAATFDGWEDPRTILVREWLNTEFVKAWYGKLVMSLYLRFGERVAKSKFAVRMLRPLFMLALKKAQANG